MAVVVGTTVQAGYPTIPAMDLLSLRGAILIMRSLVFLLRFRHSLQHCK
jgi:hypothetical protein